MRAFTINEVLDFNRDGNPLSKMDIGESYIDMDFIKNTDWSYTHDFIFNHNKIIKMIKNYMGFPIILLKNKFNKYIALSTLDIETHYYSDPDIAINEIQNLINKL